MGRGGIASTGLDKEALRHYGEEQGALNAILRVALDDQPLPQQFERVLDILLALSWLPIQPKGGIFQVDDDGRTLVLKAQRNLARPLLTACARIPFGHCLCGRAAETREMQYAHCIDGRHDVGYEGMEPHGHYSVPILSKAGVLGVIVLYLEEGHAANEREGEFLRSVANTLAGLIEHRRTQDALHRALRNYEDSESRLDRLAHHDPLTELPNRLLLTARMEHALARARRDNAMVAVLFLDLDHFKDINDTLGHPVGDLLLKETARRLTTCAREEDTVSRVGGDEFTIVLEGIKDTRLADAVAQRILGDLTEKFVLDGHEVFISCSIGISLFPGDGQDVVTLLKNADSALYRAKEQGRANCQYYTQELTVRAVERLAMETRLRHAVERGELRVYYQPQVDFYSGQVIGMEALLRWQHPEMGFILPKAFIALAEETGLIVPIGEWVLRTACARLKAWIDAGLPKIRVAVNIASRQFNHKGLYAAVASALRDSGLPGDCLELELTERIVTEDAEAAIATLTRLKGLGVQLSIDDFGTGYSSLAYLKRFPIDRIKIDQSFVRNITTDPQDAAVSQAIIAMSHSLNLKTVAEGVETAEQQEFLRARECDEFQGFHFSHPLPEAEMEQLLKEGTRLSKPPQARAEQWTLLLVDDEPNVLHALTRVLRPDGYRILCAGRPAEALALMATEEVAVIVSDHRLPEMSGIDLLRRVRSMHPGAVRVLMTGYADVNVITSALNDSEIYKLILKPWSDEQLRGDIRKAVQQHARLGRLVKNQ